MESGPDVAVAAGCVAPSLWSLTASLLPWAGILALTALFIGGGVAWISRRAGDNRWEALRHGLLAAFVSGGPLLTVLAVVVNLMSRCR
ncbi:hypothetical protein [Streptomyces sp. NPDC014995]|uniref:hypothetical protein n=1 Tax=Streptomyces sp. NPDC014995 TaxID=3364936 RepID=UPI003702942E